MIVFDLETDGLLPELTVIHCVNMVDTETGQRRRYNEVFRDHPDYCGGIADAVDYLGHELGEGNTIAGHNVIGFDIPAIQKLYPDFRPHMDQVLDTLVCSRLIWTDLKDMDQRAIRRGRRPVEFRAAGLAGKHSLEAWGWRLGDYKGDFKGPWDTFTAEMDDYCAQDVEVTVKLADKIAEQDYSQEAIRLEHRVAEIIRLQEEHGFRFDVEAAQRLEIELTAELADLEDKLREIFPPWFVAERKYGKPVVMDPKRRRSAKAEMPDGRIIKSEYVPGAPYSKVKLVSFEPSSRDMIADRLIKVFGWVPQEFSEKTGKPTVDEDTLGGLVMPEAKTLIRYLVTAKLRGTVATGKKAWLKKVGPDGRIHSRVNTNGAVTGRMTHADHMAQVPRIKKDDDGHPIKGYEGRYGYEARSLFIAGEGKTLVGVDAETLELRMLAHYMARYDEGVYGDAVVNGDKKLGTDNHSQTQRVVGLRTRDGAKTWMYAYLYGAGDQKLGTTHYEDMDEAWQEAFNRKNPPGIERERAFARLGRRGRGKIETGLPALASLQEAIRDRARRDKKLRGLDGRWLHVRGLHSALNTLLQGAGAITMKKALVLAYDALVARGWEHGREFAMVANIHDEVQIETLPENASDVGTIVADAIRRAGEAFELRCPLAGSADVGDTWAATH